MELPDELWNIVKDFQLDYKRKHKRNMNPCLEHIDGLYSEVYLYSSVFPSLGYGQEVGGGEYDGLWVPHNKCKPRVYQPRYRRDCLGELIQILHKVEVVTASHLKF